MAPQPYVQLTLLTPVDRLQRSCVCTSRTNDKHRCRNKALRTQTQASEYQNLVHDLTLGFYDFDEEEHEEMVARLATLSVCKGCADSGGVAVVGDQYLRNLRDAAGIVHRSSLSSAGSEVLLVDEQEWLTARHRQGLQQAARQPEAAMQAAGARSHTTRLPEHDEDQLMWKRNVLGLVDTPFDDDQLRTPRVMQLSAQDLSALSDPPSFIFSQQGASQKATNKRAARTEPSGRHPSTPPNENKQYQPHGLATPYAHHSAPVKHGPSSSSYIDHPSPTPRHGSAVLPMKQRHTMISAPRSGSKPGPSSTSSDCQLADRQQHGAGHLTSRACAVLAALLALSALAALFLVYLT
ncbi:hypothetical protein LTR37_005843 [Vermiconidia calcicola]|uniref:Uncharacterized protein n=1 Tax=Vermiconidia calcicola TaxID=1690605 RepID=A0ACC3NI17_9PEZI|nr:hypothetical protein LTR37_005843 [Vermiconidia calcicola]